MAHAPIPWLIWNEAALCIFFVAFVPLRILDLRTRQRVVQNSILGTVKPLLAVSCSLSLLSNLISTYRIAPPDLSHIPVTSSLIGLVGVGVLSCFEHQKSIIPSDVITLYLLASTIIHGTSLWFVLAYNTWGSAQVRSLLICIFCKIIMLVTEAWGKRSIILDVFTGLAPEETSGITQRAVFWWVNSILRHGAMGVLGIHESQIIDKELDADVLRERITEIWDNRERLNMTASLPKILFTAIAPAFLWAIPSRLFLILFQYGQPLLIKVTVRVVSDGFGVDSFAATVAWILMVAFLVYFGDAISGAIHQHQQSRLRVMIRGALIGLVHTKTMQARSEAYDNGEALALANTDIDSLSLVAGMIHDTWAYLLHLVIGMVLLGLQIGWISPVPLFIIFVCSRISSTVTRNIRIRQREWNDATQSRLSLINSLLSSIKTIKLLGITDNIANKISNLRSDELQSASTVRWVMFAYNASANANGIFTPAITIMLYGGMSMWHGKMLDAESAFTSTAILSLVIHPANMIMTILPRIDACFASFERIEAYLLKSPHQDPRVRLCTSSQAQFQCSSQVAVDILFDSVDLEAPDSHKVLLKDVSLNVERSSIVVCTGSTGAGKTLLAKAILGEVPVARGSIGMGSERISYCGQTPWIPTGTIKDIICNFSTSVDEARYQSVCSAACLTQDILDMPSGAQTQVGSRGINISGGQRQRLALARLLYDLADIVILDDPLSSLDGITEVKIIQNLFGPEGIFRSRKTTVFWISHMASSFQLADRVLVVNQGSVKTYNSWEDLPPLSLVNHKAVTNSSASTKRAQVPLRSNDQLALAKSEGRYQHLPASGSVSIYKYYFEHSGPLNTSFMISCTAIYSFFITFPHYWLKYWIEANIESQWFYMVGYGVLALCAWIATNGTMWSTYMLVAPTSGSSLHGRLLGSIARAPLSYFAANSIGTTLNRFSQDIQLIDRELPGAFQMLNNQIFKLLAQVSLLVAVEKSFLVALSISLCVIYGIGKIYSRTSHQVRVQELALRSEVTSQIVETVEGITTIRAFGWQSHCHSQLDKVLDRSQGSFYLLFCIQRWLNLVLNLMVATVAMMAIAAALYMPNQVGGAAVGVALNVILVTNTTIVRLIESWAAFEISLGAVERLKVLGETMESESCSDETICPPSNWPVEGRLIIQNLSASYQDSGVALEDISLTVEAGQKVVVCGKTGSGKSTLLLSLLRVMKTRGAISVDGISLLDMNAEAVRDRCFITVPQDSILLYESSLRFSLDPGNEVGDDVIIEALRKTGLWQFFNELDTVGNKPILDVDISTLPPLSSGQVQLLGLSRALVKKSVLGACCRPVVLMDEVTSSLDSATEVLINDLVDEEFTAEGYTVVVVAHRLSSIIERMKPADLVVTMDGGRVASIANAVDVR